MATNTKKKSPARIEKDRKRKAAAKRRKMVKTSVWWLLPQL